MTTKITPVPKGYHNVTPYLVVTNAAKAIEFYTQAFGAIEHTRMAMPDGKVMHAEIKIGDSPIMMCDEFPDWGSLSPETVGGTSVSLMLYVEDADMVVNRAVAAGATLLMPVEDQFWGDRCGSVRDPFGHKWTVGTHTEDVSPEEVNARAEKMFCAQ